MGVGLTYQNKKYPGSSSSDLSCVCGEGGRERGCRRDVSIQKEWNFVGQRICGGINILSRKEEGTVKEGQVWTSVIIQIALR